MDVAQQVQDFLVQDWSAGLRLTSIPQAMRRRGIPDDAQLRWRVGRDLEALWRDTLTSPETRRRVAAALGWSVEEGQPERWREQVGTWHLASVLLSEDEKLVARHVLKALREDAPLPAPQEIARALGLPVRTVHQAFRMLARLGFLFLPDGRRPAHYALAEGYERLLEGLGFNFHTVTLDTGETYGVP